MKKAILEQLKAHIGKWVKATGRKVYNLYEIEGELLEVHTETTPEDRRCYIQIKVSEPRDEIIELGEGNKTVLHYSGIETIFSTHLVSVKTEDGRTYFTKGR